MDTIFKVSLLICIFAIAAISVQSAQNGHYQYATNGNTGIIVDTRTGEFWTEDGDHFEPRTAHITAHHPLIDDETANDDRTIRFKDCLHDAVAHRKSAKDCVDQNFGSHSQSPKSTVTSPASTTQTTNP